MLQYIIIMLEIPMKNWRKFLTKVIGLQGKKFVKIAIKPRSNNVRRMLKLFVIIYSKSRFRLADRGAR